MIESILVALTIESVIVLALITALPDSFYEAEWSPWFEIPFYIFVLISLIPALIAVVAGLILSVILRTIIYPFYWLLNIGRKRKSFRVFTGLPLC